MPNVKIYVDEAVYKSHTAALTDALLPLRDIVSEHLEAPHSACQLALISIVGLSDQPAVNVEISIMPRSNRTKETLESMGAELQRLLGEITKQSVAFRCAQLDPSTYVTLKKRSV